MSAFFVYITTKDKAEAREIGRHLVHSKIAACVNILDQMNSMYVWQGEFQDDQEAVMIAKTTEEKVPELIAAVKARHSYECPCIVALPITDGHPDFLNWISRQVAP
ncbi:MAG: divalent-cation tolerance protein CutA [Desulfobacteraceae bacterium]|jgi:periplasmic divalent cation tolerance protein